MDKKDAMKILKDFHDKSALFSVRTALETVFPEFLESKDERIRQQLLYMVKEEKEVMNNHLGVRGMSYDDMITWLEKQGEQKDLAQNQEPETEDESIRKWCISHFKDCIRVTKDNVEYQEYLNNKVIPWLEKQGEKPQDEDEKIRTAIIYFISHTPTVPKGIIDKEQMLTWLEKQGKHEQEINNFGVLPGLYKCVLRMFDGTSEGRLLFEVGNVYRCLSKHNNRAEFEVSHGHSVSLEDSIICKHFVPFEKQNEQNYESHSIAESRPAKKGTLEKLVDRVEFPFKAKVKKNNKIVIIIGGQLDDSQPKDSRSYITYSSDATDGYKTYKPEELEFIKQSEFKIGDWIIIYGGKPYKILKIEAEVNGILDYLLLNQDGHDSYYNKKYVDKNARLWTVRDAKDGDVLVCGEDKSPFLFKGFDKFHPECPVAYCGIDAVGTFIVKPGNGLWTDKEVCPATKEQHDLLFQKMKEAGYSWDKKLKKNTKFSKGDWIYRGTGDPYFVESVFEEQYELCSGFGYHFNKGISEVDSDYRLWNINDARFGDILADDNTIAIYEEQSTKTFFHVLCYYCKTFVPKKGTLAVLGFHPATKEQREFFSNELKKSGYNLDLEKKQLADQPELTKFEQSLKHIIEEALDDGDTHNLKADAELLLSVANQDRVKIELTKEEEDALEQAIISLEDMFDDSQPETCYAGHHVPFDVAAKCLSNLMDKILNSK